MAGNGSAALSLVHVRLGPSRMPAPPFIRWVDWGDHVRGQGSGIC
jgi:hypothetical protein